MTRLLTRKQLGMAYISHAVLEFAWIALAWYFYDWRLALILFFATWILNSKLRLIEQQMALTIQERSKLL